MRTVVLTTSPGRDELTRRGAATLDSVEVRALNSSSGPIAPLAILELLQSQFGVKTLLHEGGPTLFGQFLAEDAVDELFLTLSPQIAGRERNVTRPALVQGVQFMPDSAPWLQTGPASSNTPRICICATGGPESDSPASIQNTSRHQQDLPDTTHFS